MQVVRIGLDLAKYVFEVHGVDNHGKVVVRKRLRRDAVAGFFANLPACLVGMEASNGAHYWARVLTALGHQVRLISPQFVTPYVKSNKNDQNDAEAICEAVGRPSMRFVPPKSTDQLAVQAVHRIRRRLVADRVRLANQIRGLLSEHGIVIARDIAQLRRGLAVIVGNINDGLSEMLRALMRELQEELSELDSRVAAYDRRIREIFRTNEQCQRLGKIEGVGPVTATALIAAVGDRSCFKNGRQFAAWLGLVPKQRGSCQQERADRVGYAHRRRSLCAGAVGEGGLKRSGNQGKEVSPGNCNKWQEMAKTVTPSLPEPDVWTGTACADVSGPLRWKPAKTIEARGGDVVQPHQEAGYTSAVVTVDPDQAGRCNRAGSIYVYT